MSSKYYCTKCQHNHLYSSKIGKNHLKFKKNSQKSIKKQEQNELYITDVQNQASVGNILKNEELDKSNINYKDKRDKRSSNRVIRFIRDYQKSYRKGIEMYGVWWKVFQLSIWSIICIFLLTASIIFIVFLPKIDFINWIIR